MSIGDLEIGITRAIPEFFSYDSLIDTLTFLFTDIEGSTALVLRVGTQVYARILQSHGEIVRAVLADHGGVEQGVRGDSFFAVFTSPSSAIAAALRIQKSLAEYDWPEGECIRVRMGIHTGEVTSTSTGLVGYEIHKAARIADIGWGGQVLISSTVAGLVADWLAEGVSLRSLGSHRLKDLGRPETIFQLVAEDLQQDFPPLRSLDSSDMPNNLPASLSQFIGRSEEIEEVKTLVVHSRLVTLTGAGGSGKTRLALQVAAELLDGSGEGVWLTDLAGMSDETDVPLAILNALGVTAEGANTPIDALVAVLKDQYLLLILDNCEHLLDVVSRVTVRIGRHCPRVHILVTSREPLGVDGEEVCRVRSMSLPEDDAESADDAMASDSVRLFVARAQSRDKSLELTEENAGTIIAICRRLDGIPLALELAAARLSTMALNDLHERLDERFRLLTGGNRSALPRHQTLAATVAWSFGLLNASERVVLRRLAVFSDGFEIEAIEAVCAGDDVDGESISDVIGSLVTKSLVNFERHPTYLRYRMLETIRQYAVDQLLDVAGEDEVREVRRLHANFYREFAERAEPFLRGGDEQLNWIDRVEREWGNIVVAASHFEGDPHGSEDLLKLCVALGSVIADRRSDQFAVLIDRVLRSDDRIPPALRARSLLCLEVWTRTSSWLRESGTEQIRQNHADMIEALELARSANDLHLEASASAALGMSLFLMDKSDLARPHWERAFELALDTGDDYLICQIATMIGWQLLKSEQGEEMRRYLDIAAIHAQRAKDLIGLAHAIFRQAQSNDPVTDEDVRNEMLLREDAFRLAERIGSLKLQAYSAINLSMSQILIGNIDEAVSWSRRGIALARRLGWSEDHVGLVILVMGCCATRRGDFRLGAQLLGAFDYWESRRLGHANEYWTTREIQLREATREVLIRALGENDYRRSTAPGDNLSFEQAARLALAGFKPKP